MTKVVPRRVLHVVVFVLEPNGTTFDCKRNEYCMLLKRGLGMVSHLKRRSTLVMPHSILAYSAPD